MNEKLVHYSHIPCHDNDSSNNDTRKTVYCFFVRLRVKKVCVVKWMWRKKQRTIRWVSCKKQIISMWHRSNGLPLSPNRLLFNVKSFVVVTRSLFHFLPLSLTVASPSCAQHTRATIPLSQRLAGHAATVFLHRYSPLSNTHTHTRHHFALLQVCVSFQLTKMPFNVFKLNNLSQ